MASRNHIPPHALNHLPSHHHHHLDDARLLHHHRLLEDRIAAGNRRIDALLSDNQHLAATHVALKKELAAIEKDLLRLSATASAVKADSDARVRDFLERSLKLEVEARSVEVLSAELSRVRTDVEELRADRNKLREKFNGVNEDLAKARLELKELEPVKSEIEAMSGEIQRGRSAIEHERKAHAYNHEISEAMEEKMISIAREIEKLQSELADAEKRAMAAATAASIAANPGTGYAASYMHFVTGYGRNISSDPYAVHQVGIVATPQYGPVVLPHYPHEMQQYHAYR